MRHKLISKVILMEKEANIRGSKGFQGPWGYKSKKLGGKIDSSHVYNAWTWTVALAMCAVGIVVSLESSYISTGLFGLLALWLVIRVPK